MTSFVLTILLNGSFLYRGDIPIPTKSLCEEIGQKGIEIVYDQHPDLSDTNLSFRCDKVDEP